MMKEYPPVAPVSIQMLQDALEKETDPVRISDIQHALRILKLTWKHD